VRILFAYDGSEQSRRALRYAERLVADDEVSVISVAAALIEAPRTAEYTDPTSDPSLHRHQLEEGRVILAEARGVELIVVGRRGQHKVERFLMGRSPTASSATRPATCSSCVDRAPGTLGAGTPDGRPRSIQARVAIGLLASRSCEDVERRPSCSITIRGVR
jgi:nucleotide-binding universal stress UspA family protein